MSTMDATSEDLSVVESMRVSAILQETVEKLTFLGSITPDMLQHRDELSQIVGDEISRIIQEQRTLEDKYERLVAKRSQLKGLSNKSKFKENQKAIQEVSRSLRESTKNLCRNLKTNPNIGGNLLKIQSERQSLIDLLGETIEDLKSQNFKSLVARVAEEKASTLKSESIINQEKEMTASVKSLDAELTRAKAEHTREVAEQKQLIISLKEQLLKLKSKTQVDIAYARKEVAAKTASTTQMFSQIIKDQEDEINSKTTEIATEERVHKETVAFLTKHQAKLAAEAEEWSAKYDNDLKEKQNEIELLTSQRNENLKKLSLLQARWDLEKQEEAAAEEEKVRLAELDVLRRAEEKKQNEAASVIQGRFKKFTKEKAPTAPPKKEKKKKK